MRVVKTGIEGCVLIEPTIYTDSRGFFFESFNARVFEHEVGHTPNFVQDNESRSVYGVIRGLHYQLSPNAQAKLVRVVKGRVWDVVVDIRKSSPTFGKYIAVELSEDNHLQCYIDKGLAHGFAVLSEEAIFQYKCDAYYSKQDEAAIVWNDPQLNIPWPIPVNDIILSDKDRQQPLLRDAKLFE